MPSFIVVLVSRKALDFPTPNWTLSPRVAKKPGEFVTVGLACVKLNNPNLGTF